MNKQPVSRQRSRACFFVFWIVAGGLIGSFSFAAAAQAGSISGKITTDGTNGIAGVYAQAFKGDINNWVTNAAVTDSTGNYIIEGLEDDSNYIVRFWAHETDYVTRWYSDLNINGVDYSEATPITVAGGGDTPDVNIQLLPGGSISGTVTYHETGAPVINAWIDVYDNNEAWRGYAETDADGYYQVVGLPDGPHKLQVFEVFEPSVGGLTEWYRDKASFDTATQINVTAEVDNGKRNVSLGGPAVLNWLIFTPALTHRPVSP